MRARWLLHSVVFLVLASCGKSEPELGAAAEDASTPRTLSPDGSQDALVDVSGTQPGPKLENVLQSITASEIEKDLTYIASEPRPMGTEATKRAADYIAKRFAEWGLTAKADGSFLQPYAGRYQNIVAMVPGGDLRLKDQYILVSSHYDSWPISPGADDNGSGTVTVMHIARAMTKYAHAIKRSVIFAIFDGEEDQPMGSEYYVYNPVYSLEDTAFVVNFDMVGRANTNKNKLQFRGLTLLPLVKQQADEVCAPYTICNTDYGGDGGGGDTDSQLFIDMGIRAIWLFTGSHDCHHKACDTVDKIDFPTLTNVVKVGFELVYRMANEPRAIL